MPHTAIAAMLVALIAAPARAQQDAVATRAMVVTAQHLATAVGRDVLAHGGNAVDAAVAVGYALAVVEPCCGNLGGGGFMTIHLADGRDRFVNFRERAPAAATADMFLGPDRSPVRDRSLFGYLAVGVPGTVAGLEHARAAYGTMPRTALIAPAIGLAAHGFTLDAGDIATLGLFTKRFAAQPNVAKTFLNDGQPWQAGERLVQPDLAATLRTIAKGGVQAFYRGPVARTIATASAANGGILTAADLDRYVVTDTPPLTCAYRGMVVVSAPPPSSGGTVLCEIMNILAPYPLGEWGAGSVRAVHATVEAERRAYADRNEYLGDPDFVQNPLARLLSAEYAAKLRAGIDPVRATPSADLRPGLGAAAEGRHTTHVSIIDARGDAVSMTYTINLFFGAGVIAGDTGFFLNDEMDDFTSKPGTPNAFGLVQGTANAIAPDKRPLSSMTPTILLRQGHPAMVVGAPGGSRIPTEVLGVIQNVFDYGMTLPNAVAAPRFHQQYLPDVVELEPGALDPATRAALTADGYALQEAPRPWGLAEAILVDPVTGAIHGASDPRKPDGAAMGLGR